LQQNERHISERNRCIQQFADKYKIPGYSDEISEEEAKSFRSDHVDSVARSVMKTAGEKKVENLSPIDKKLPVLVLRMKILKMTFNYKTYNLL